MDHSRSCWIRSRQVSYLQILLALSADGLTSRFQASRASPPASPRLSRFNSLTRRTKRLRLFQLSIREKWTEMLRTPSLFAVLLLCFASQFVGGQDQSLSIQIKVNQTQVKNKEPLWVVVTIRNSGATEEELQTWACGFPSEWISDNTEVNLHQVNCVQDTMRKIKLKPGESYKRKVPVEVQLPTSQMSQEPITFRLGFGNAFHYGDKQPDQRGRAIWSNAVTVSVSM